MCNTTEQEIAWREYCEMLQRIAWHIPTRQGELDLQPLAKVTISDTAAVMVANEAGEAELRPMTFSWRDERTNKPKFNVQSEWVKPGQYGRAILPASAFIEFSAATDPKQKRKDRWRLRRADGDWMGIASVWKLAEGNQQPRYALLTIGAGEQVAPMKDREPVVLEPQHWKAWVLEGDKAGFATSLAGAFTVEAA